MLAEKPYSPRGLGALQRTGVLGLLIPELSNPVFPAFAEALETRAAGRGYSTVLCNTHSASIREEEYVRMLLARGVEGMVFVSPEATDVRASHDHYRQLKAEGVHMVFVNGGMPSLEVPDVGVDEQAAGYLATRHLVELGHRTIGFVSGPTRSMPARLKAAGWAVALEEAGLRREAELVVHAPYGPAGGAAAMGRLLDGPQPTAVICSSDLMALGAISEARRRGLTVPRDLSVVGFDDIPHGRVLHAGADHARPADRGDRAGRGGRPAGRHGEHPAVPAGARPGLPARGRRPRLHRPAGLSRSPRLEPHAPGLRLSGRSGGGGRPRPA